MAGKCSVFFLGHHLLANDTFSETLMRWRASMGCKHARATPSPWLRVDDGWWWWRWLMLYGHFCAQGRLNGPSDLQGKWGEVKDETNFRVDDGTSDDNSFVELISKVPLDIDTTIDMSADDFLWKSMGTWMSFKNYPMTKVAETRQEITIRIEDDRTARSSSIPSVVSRAPKLVLFVRYERQFEKTRTCLSWITFSAQG